MNKINFKTEYRSGQSNVVEDFYIPALSNAILYKRAVGFFSSSALIQISKGIAELVKNGGKIQLIASPRLSEEDIIAIEKGYEEKNKIIENALISSFLEPKNHFEEERLNLLAHLIEKGSLDIKIAFLSNGSSYGIYHEKMGLIYDKNSNIIAFSGSTNESETAFINNYEVLDIYKSWGENFEKKKVQDKELAFNLLWTNADKKVEAIEFPKILLEKLKKYKKEKVNYNIDDIEIKFMKKSIFIKKPSHINYYEYQIEAVNNWKNNNFNGIYNMATGTGKTITALYSLNELANYLNDKLFVIIVVPYQHLVEQWAEDAKNYSLDPIIAYSSSHQRKWKDYFKDAIMAFNLNNKNSCCVITTNGTFNTDFFQKQITKIKQNGCFIVDEAHNFGATNIRKKLPKNFKYRLALSATIDRHRDELGTNILKNYFGKECQNISLKYAIDNGFLTSYYYYPILITLTKEELEEYQNISRKIIKMGGASEENCLQNPSIELLLIKRSRIIAGAKNKVSKLIKTIEPFKNDSHMLVYCGATNYHNEYGEDLRQIDKINKSLYKHYCIKVRKFTSSENKNERKQIIESFIYGRELQVITAIRCLDEGVNIPAIRRAFILASSTNPKEYIQRRGRVLRKFKGKKFAEIYDFITIPRDLNFVKFIEKKEIGLELSLIKKEFTRMMDFADSARNPFEIDELKEKILTAYNFYNDELLEEEYE